MKEHVLTSIRITLVLLVLLCAVYPAAVWAIGRIAFREAADGSLLKRDGKVIGSSLIAQSFTSPKYFHPRPSAAGSGYDAMASSGSNLGPTSQKLNDRITGSIAAWSDTRPEGGIPADAVTTSGSGLDPHISPENARAQAARIAKERQMSIEEINTLIEERTEGRFLAIYGEPRVNVLLLNLTLDERKR
ncbi:MAG: K(+)-transporting ATPase subunit C [Thermoanaerobaculia bacterium]|jgi:K+-transporting ATPase ATPase C chain